MCSRPFGGTPPWILCARLGCAAFVLFAPFRRGVGLTETVVASVQHARAVALALAAHRREALSLEPSAWDGRAVAPSGAIDAR